MKKSLAILFSVLYLFLSTGILFSVHYCGGKAVDFQISLSAETGSCGSGPESCVEMCCGNETVLLKIDSEHLYSAPAFPSQVVADAQIPYETQAPAPVKLTSAITQGNTSNAPPPKGKLFKKHCALITYG